MTLVGVKFLNETKNLKLFAGEIRQNSEKQVAKMLFNVKVYTPEPDVLIVNKQFLHSELIVTILSFLLIASAMLIIFFKLLFPTFICYCLFLAWVFFDSPAFNYWLLKLMFKRLGYKGKLRML